MSHKKSNKVVTFANSLGANGSRDPREALAALARRADAGSTEKSEIDHYGP